MLLAGVFGLLSLVNFVSSAYAADPEAIKDIQKEIKEYICSETDWLRCYNKPPGQCMELADKIVDDCIEKQLKFAPERIELGEALQYTVEASFCFNEKVPEVLGPKNPGSACEVPPGHLQ